MVPAWPAASQLSKAAACSGGLAGPTTTRSKPRRRPASLIRIVRTDGVMTGSSGLAASQRHHATLRQCAPALADEPLPRRPSAVRFPAWTHAGDPGQRLRLGREPRDLLLHLETLDAQPGLAQHGAGAVRRVREARHPARLAPLVGVERREGEDPAWREARARPHRDRVGHTE